MKPGRKYAPRLSWQPRVNAPSSLRESPRTASVMRSTSAKRSAVWRSTSAPASVSVAPLRPR